MNTSYAFDSVNPVVLALGYYWRRGQSSGRNSDDDEKYDSDYSLPTPPRHHSHPGDVRQPSQGPRRSGRGSTLKWFLIAVVGLLIIALIVMVPTAMFVNWAKDQMQDYVPVYNGDTPVAQIASTAQGGHMKIHLTLLDNRGHGYADKNCDNCVASGNAVVLKGDMLRFSGWSGLFLTSGYKLTTLEAYYNNAAHAKNRVPEDIVLNGGDDKLFRDMQQWGSMIGAQATVSNSVTVPADGRTYNVLISPTKGLYIQPVKTTSTVAGED